MTKNNRLRIDHPAIQTKGLCKTYKLYGNVSDQAIDILGFSKLMFWRHINSQTFRALHDINLTIKRGERIGIIGRNGAGKTTLLKIITGTAQPTEGTIDVTGDIQALMQVGLGFHPEFTGQENIEASLLYSGLTVEERRQAEKEIVDFCELGDFLTQPLKTYSLGMQSRLQFACSTAVRPDILVIDEVLGAGDAYFSVKSSARMEKLANSGSTIVLVSHATQQIIQFCERALWIDGGQIKMDGEVHDVVGAYEVMIAQEVKQSKILTLNAPGAEADLLTNHVLYQEAPKDVEADDFQETLAKGMKVFRWESNVGVKIRDLKVYDLNGEEDVFQSGQKIRIDLLMECEIDGDLTVCTHVAVFNDVGVRVAWITSPQDRFKGSVGMQRLALVEIDELLLSEGNYTLSISLFEGTDPRDISAAKRFDLLARCYNFGVISQEVRSHPTFYHPSDWHYETISELQKKKEETEVIVKPDHN